MNRSHQRWIQDRIAGAIFIVAGALFYARPQPAVCTLPSQVSQCHGSDEHFDLAVNRANMDCSQVPVARIH
jgi:hypothetical protein